MSRAIPASLIVAALALPLAACGGGGSDKGADSRQAEGEVLEGSVSDAMIPFDQLRSQGDLLRETAGEAGGAAREAGEEDPASDEAPAVEAGAAGEPADGEAAAD